MIDLAQYNGQPIKNFTPEHELFIYKLTEDPQRDKKVVYREHFNKPDISDSTIRVQLAKILSHPRVKEIVQAFQEHVRELVVKSAAISRESLINDLQRIKERCMQDQPVMGYYGDQDEGINPNYNPEKPENGGKVIGIYTFQPGAAVKAIIEIGKLLNYYETTVNVKHSVIDRITQDLPQALPAAQQQDSKEIESADYSIEELQQDIDADIKSIEAAKKQGIQAGINTIEGQDDTIQGTPSQGNGGAQEDNN